MIVNHPAIALFRALFTRSRVGILLVAAVFVFESSMPLVVRAIDCPKEWNTPACSGIKSGGGTDWIPFASTGCGESGVNLTGKDIPELVWNYFYGQLQNDNLAAAVWGNIKQESQFVPNVVEGGERSNDPRDAGTAGWGLVQWTPGAKVLDVQKKAKITGPIYEATTQVQIVWWEMVNIAPTSKKEIVKEFLNTSGSLEEAVEYFRKNYEAGTPGNRLAYAKEALAKYGGGKGSGSCSNTSPDCEAAQGNAKILCAAKRYDPVSYGWGAGHGGGAAWHKTCPTINTKCSLDCSGLVNIVLYDLIRIDLRQNTFGQVSDTEHWERVALDDLQAGDLIQPNPDHVEIVDHVEGDRVITFGAHSANKPQPDQVGPSSWPKSGIGLRWKGTL
ncbi:hypothetical protein KBD11_00035 [Candidatus Saccharibacteria bacterium]|nr:hypothetical protein [Candidatus Saccharibacteria bacterium]